VLVDRGREIRICVENRDRLSCLASAVAGHRRVCVEYVRG
jgi:hypothetical protein